MRGARNLCTVLLILIALATGKVGAMDFFSYWGSVCDGGSGHEYHELGQLFQTGCHCATQACEIEAGGGGFCASASDYCEEFCNANACGVNPHQTFCSDDPGPSYDCVCEPCGE